MFEIGKDVEDEERQTRAHALLDAVLRTDPATATGAELSQLMTARASLTAMVDGAAVAAVPQWEASADWAADGSATVVTHLVNHTGAHRSAAAALRRTGLDAASMPHVSAAAREGRLPLSHLHLLTRARRPEVASVFDRDEEALVAEARKRTADSLSAWLRAWRFGALEELGVNEPDSPLDHDSEQSTAKIVTGFAGRGLVTLDLTPVALAAVVEAVEARIETWRRAGQLTEDDRTWQELVAAALLDLIADGSGATAEPPASTTSACCARTTTASCTTAGPSYEAPLGSCSTDPTAPPSSPRPSSKPPEPDRSPATWHGQKQTGDEPDVHGSARAPRGRNRRAPPPGIGRWSTGSARGRALVGSALRPSQGVPTCPTRACSPTTSGRPSARRRC